MVDLVEVGVSAAVPLEPETATATRDHSVLVEGVAHALVAWVAAVSNNTQVRVQVNAHAWQ